MRKRFKYEDYNEFDCIFIKETKNYIIGKDFNGIKYKIKKSNATKKFKVGYQNLFFAVLRKEGILKNNVLYPILFEDYLILKERFENKH